MARQRLVVLFDGTWNDPETRTNVYRLAGRIHDYDAAVRQRFFYHPGVGTGSWDRFRGGIFGYGLTQNLLEGYQWLAKNYTDGDEIWLFGFSRGAYTARSLAGLIRKCGLLRIYTPRLLDEAERIYRDKTLAPDCDECRTFRDGYSRMPRIHFLGVWDTVGALGVPGTFLSEHGKYAWHDTELSGIVDHACHAMALDEHRAAYDTALWVTDDGRPKASNIAIEQRWFVGAHANVGGGYGLEDTLADIPLAWMMGRAQAAGLKLDGFSAAAGAWQMPPRDSYSEFLRGLYAGMQQLFRRGEGRHYRSFATGHDGRLAVNVSVDPSVWLRWQEVAAYRPPTLVGSGQLLPD